MSIKISCSENHSQILGMKGQIKTLENDLINMESLMKKMIENQNEIKQSGRKYTKSSNEDFQWVQKMTGAQTKTLHYSEQLKHLQKSMKCQHSVRCLRNVRNNFSQRMI